MDTVAGRGLGPGLVLGLGLSLGLGLVLVLVLGLVLGPPIFDVCVLEQCYFLMSPYHFRDGLVTCTSRGGSRGASSCRTSISS
jgi:hypothetical protein